MTTSAPDPKAQRRARTRVIGLVLALAAGSALYRLLVWGSLEQTAALFIGVPTLLAVWVALLPPATTAVGTAMRGTTLALLMSGIFLGEGYLCILMSAPLFYGVAFLAALAVESWSSGGRSRRSLKSIVLVPLVVSSVEGVTPGLSFDRTELVVAERIVEGSPAEVRRALEAPLCIDAPLPAALRIGFPRPERAAGGGLAVGDERRVFFTGGEGRPPGALRIVVAESSPQHAVFVFPEDTSHIPHWLRWREARVRWEAAGARSTRVEWTLVYDRELDPGWYWRPFGRFFVAFAAEYLIDAAATPPSDA